MYYINEIHQRYANNKKLCRYLVFMVQIRRSAKEFGQICIPGISNFAKNAAKVKNTEIKIRSILKRIL